ncbi:ECF transporter S component [Amedibacillus dolichus]|uniref:ECF transporter S component n=1 Tax=Amedibacillus dolichus DSM 3991 TaxID=428127 RepID=A8R845_9FIRM|nr:ECF transporter S component [Amedibacillus dolichus]EDP12269.1 hypothetical protein EUBDOL_00178 [Amedibacillus dolichus DSM 3991]
MRTNQKLSVSALMLALGMVLPFFTGQIAVIGNMLLPMHIPVFLCGLLCGWRYGLFIGFSLPLLRGMVFGMPIVYPTGLAMAFELATYGIVVGYLYERSHKQGIRALYCALLSAMVIGRVVWGCIEVMLLGVGGKLFTWEMFIANAFVQAIPGILLQLVLIPCVMLLLDHTGLICFHGREKEQIGICD